MGKRKVVVVVGKKQTDSNKRGHLKNIQKRDGRVGNRFLFLFLVKKGCQAEKVLFWEDKKTKKKKETYNFILLCLLFLFCLFGGGEREKDGRGGKKKEGGVKSGES